MKRIQLLTDRTHEGEARFSDSTQEIYEYAICENDTRSSNMQARIYACTFTMTIEMTYIVYLNDWRDEDEDQSSTT